MTSGYLKVSENHQFEFIILIVPVAFLLHSSCFEQPTKAPFITALILWNKLKWLNNMVTMSALKPDQNHCSRWRITPSNHDLVTNVERAVIQSSLFVKACSYPGHAERLKRITALGRDKDLTLTHLSVLMNGGEVLTLGATQSRHQGSPCHCL